MSALVTEHFVLQSTASATISESGGRVAIYLSALSWSAWCCWRSASVTSTAASRPWSSARRPRCAGATRQT